MQRHDGLLFCNVANKLDVIIRQSKERFHISHGVVITAPLTWLLDMPPKEKGSDCAAMNSSSSKSMRGSISASTGGNSSAVSYDEIEVVTPGLGYGLDKG